MNRKRKPHLATDFYQLSVCNVYFEEGIGEYPAVFDLFIRKNPFHGGFTVFAGLEEIIEYIEHLSFDEEDIEMLHKNHPELTEGFLNYLREFRFTGDIYSVKEGEVVFPNEPLVKVKAPLIQAQLIETTLLTIVNHQSLIATKASRVCSAADGEPVLDFGLRRAHGIEAGLFGARSAMIGGCAGTSNVEAEYCFDLISKGTMSHAYVMSFEHEYDAFYKFALANQAIILLVDTYDTLKSGVPNAIKVFDKIKQEGIKYLSIGIRLDSGDLAYLSKQSRRMLDEAGHKDAVISASSDLDEYLISDLKIQGAKIDLWGVGTKMITAYDTPALGAVYKLSNLDNKPRIKISDAPEKITNPGDKTVLRFIAKESGMIEADLIALDDDELDESKPITIFHPLFPYKKRTLTNIRIEKIQQAIFRNGKRCYDLPDLSSITEYQKQRKDQLWQEYKRFTNPNEFHVDLSDRLYDLKKTLIKEHQDLRGNHE